MDTATLLKRTANVVAGMTLVRAVADELAEEVRRDLSELRSQTNAMVHRSPYGAAGTAAAMGLIAGVLLSRRRDRPAA
ncbi:MAG: hypothetical protein M3O26_09925 [Pseudomonadota bacterium]|nr:hypothetical protein [Pseudomonadota bacterium]